MTGFLEGAILIAIFVFCLLLAVRHVKRAFTNDANCGCECSECPSVAAQSCPSAADDTTPGPGVDGAPVASIVAGPRRSAADG